MNRDMAERRSAPGAVITTVGIALFLLGVFGSDLPWAPDNLFLPIMLIFFGRAISKRQNEGRRMRGGVPQPSRPAKPEPVVVTAPPPPPAPEVVVEPSPRREAPSGRQERRQDRIEPVPEELPELILPLPVPERRTSTEQIDDLSKSRRDGAAVYPETGGRSPQSMARPTPSAPSHRVKTSDELIAEAKERLKRKPR